MHVELCGVNSHSSMQPAANSKSFAHIVSSDCSTTNIFLIVNKPFPDISNNTTLQLSTTALPLSAVIMILSLLQRLLLSSVRLLFYLRFVKRCAETTSGVFWLCYQSVLSKSLFNRIEIPKRLVIDKCYR